MANSTPENVARAFVEGMLCGLADGLDAVLRQGVKVQRLFLIGGAARNPAVREVARDIFTVPIDVPEQAEYVAIGAARQAAWTSDRNLAEVAGRARRDAPPATVAGATAVPLVHEHKRH